MVEFVLKFVASAFSLPFLLRVIKPNLVAPFYHIISSTNPPHIKHLYHIVTPEQFKTDLDTLLKYFIPIEAADMLNLSNVSKKSSKPAIFLSFDDGFRELLTVVAPILRAKGVPATFFISPAFIGNRDMLYRCKVSLIAERIMELGTSFQVPPFLLPILAGRELKPKQFIKKLFTLSYNDIELIDTIAINLGIEFQEYLSKYKPYLSVDELKLISSQGFTIGAHSFDHPNFSDIHYEQQINQVRMSLQWVQDNIPNQPRLFAFPFTNYGLTNQFYRYFFDENPNVCDMMFGTAGFKPTSSYQMIHRIPMEIKNRSALQVLKGELLYYLSKSIVGKHKVSLPI